ncbi:MAG: DUF2071 domain-containing protein [bacterium]
MSFLSIRHSHLINTTFSVPPEDLNVKPPSGTDFDQRFEQVYISLVGYFADNIKLWGIPIPMSSPILQLRYYVTRKNRKGYVPVKTFVPGRFTAWFNQLLYGENWEQRPMKSHFKEEDSRRTYRIKIKLDIHREKLEAVGRDPAYEPNDESDEQWILDRNYAFVPKGKNSTSCYRYKHPEWDLYHLESLENTIAYEAFFGPDWAFLTEEEPVTSVYSEGSPVEFKLPSSL